jgi:hypothetical protein
LTRALTLTLSLARKGCSAVLVLDLTVICFCCDV